jgi:hypothetical protein
MRAVCMRVPLAAAMALMLGGCQDDRRQVPATGPAGALGVPVLAYAGRAGVGLADETGRTRKLAPPPSGPAGAAPDDRHPFSHLTWSPDGRSVAWAGRNLVYLHDIAAARTRSWVCPCTGVAFLDGRMIAVQRDGTAMVVFDLRGTAPERRPITWRGDRGNTASIMGGDGRTLVVASLPGTDESFIRQARFHRVDAAGRAVPLKTASPQTAPTEGRGSPAGVAIAIRYHAHSCANFERVGLLDARAGRIIEPTMPPPADRPRYVLHYGWGTDGRLYAGFASSPVCRFETDPARRLEARSPGEIWTFSGGAWKRTPVSALGYLPGPRGMSARLEGTAVATTSAAGFDNATLVLTTARGSRLVLGRGVREFTFPTR